MIITFQAQLNEIREYTKDELDLLYDRFREYIKVLEQFGYTRGEMYINEEVYHRHVKILK